MPRTTNYGITDALIPEAVRPLVPKGIAGVELAKWYMAFETGRRFGEDSRGRDDHIYAEIMDRLNSLSAPTQAIPPSRPRLAVLTPPREPWDTDDAAVPELPKPQPDNEIALSDADLATVAEWVHAVMAAHAPGDVEKEALAMDATKRILIGYTDKPDGEIDKKPPWRNLPGGGFEGILYARFARLGLVPEPREDGTGWKTLGETN